MPDDPLPPAETCLHNLHRVGDGRDGKPDPTELCRNALGVFHMTDCPLTIGLACVYYDAAPVPHPTNTDLELEGFREDLQRDFLGWRYRKRVRWLMKPKHLVPVGIVIEGTPEPEEIVPEFLALRAPTPAELAALPVAVGAVAGPSVAGAPAVDIVGPAPAPTAAPERYPGQRRSEERLAKKKARLAALDAAAAKAAQIAAIAANPSSEPTGEGEEGDDDDGFGEDLLDAEPVDEGPKTVEEVLARLPDAPMVTSEPRRGRGPSRMGVQPDGGGQEGGPQGGPRRRRRRGRRGRGAPPQQGQRPPQGRRPGGGPPPAAGP